MSEQLHVQISELQGGMPDVPYAPGVDPQALVAGDDDPVFVTLPLLAAGAVSRNGREYDSEAVASLVEQINANRPGGILGHLSEAERATRFDLPRLMWVGAALHDGKAWGKAYVPKYAGDVREYVLKSKARRAKIATSIYGTASMDGRKVRGLQIESIDLADPSRAGLESAVAEPIITGEMTDNEEGVMPEIDALVAELTGQRDRIQNDLDTTRSRISELEGRVAELQQHEATVTAIREMMGEGDLVVMIREMRTAFAEVERVQREAAIAEAVDAALGDIRNNERGAQLIREMVGQVETPEAATARVQELLERDYVQGMLRLVVSEQAGGPAIVGNGGQTTNWKDQVVENAEALASQYGIRQQ